MNANVGMFMSPSDIILEVVDTNYLHLNLSILKRYFGMLNKDKNISFTIPEAKVKMFLIKSTIGWKID